MIKHFGLDPDKDVKFIPGGSSEGRLIRMQQGLLDATVATVPTDYHGRKMGYPVIVRSEDLFTYPFSGLTAQHEEDQRETGRGQASYSGGYQGQPLHARESRWNHPDTDEHLSGSTKRLPLRPMTLLSRASIIDGSMPEDGFRRLLDDTKRIDENRS